MRLSTARLAAFLLLAATAACRDGATNPEDRRLTVEIRRNTVPAEEETIPVGTTILLSTFVKMSSGEAVNPQPKASWSSDAPAVASVDSTGLVTGLSVGTARIVAKTGEYADTVRINVAVPVTAAISCAGITPVSLAVGGVHATTADQAVTLCINTPGDAEYALIPFNASEVAGARLFASFTAQGTKLAAGPPNPQLNPLRTGARLEPARDFAFHERLRDRSARLLEPRLQAGAELRPSLAMAAAVPKVGDLLQLNTSIEGTGCDSVSYRHGRVMAVTSKAIIVADTANPRTSNPSDVLTEQDYIGFGESFDTLVWRIGTENFGEPSDIDKNGRVIMFFTRAVNELTADGAGSYVAGFFYNRDLFQRSGSNACKGSNVGEMFYMMVPDPQGSINGNPRTRSFIRGATVGVIAHEFQHLINDSRRLYVSKAPVWEETWLNEGLSHIAEELTFYAAAGVQPGQNLDAQVFRTPRVHDAYSRFSSDNVERLVNFLEAPERTSLLGDDALGTRGAVWAFLRYAADRLPGPDAGVWSSLVNSRTQGLANLAAALGANPRDWMADWEVAMYADDAGFPTLDPRYQISSWNFRSLIPAIPGSVGRPIYSRYPLSTVQLTNRMNVNLPGGSGAYMRFGVTGGTTAAVRTTAGQQGLPAPSRLRLALVRTK